MRRGARLFLQRCAAPDVQQIVLVDAPAVLGWERGEPSGRSTVSVSSRRC